MHPPDPDATTALTVVEEHPMTEPVEYTIDELAAHTGVPSRTIRFYQSKGALHKPEIRGRKAVYAESHVERLALIGDLQDRGLRIRAIRDLTRRIDAGELSLNEWLGLEARLQAPWSEDEPTLLTEDELRERMGQSPPGSIRQLERAELITRQGTSWLVPSPGLLRASLELHRAGVDLDVARASLDISRKHLGKLADALVQHYVANAGDGFGGSGSATDLGASFDSLRTAGLETVRVVFAQEMQRSLRSMVASGEAAKVASKR